MILKDELTCFLNNVVKEYETELFTVETEGFRPITKRENTPLVVDHLISILEKYHIKEQDDGKESITNS